jgi:AcrR family transcriptional regulator
MATQKLDTQVRREQIAQATLALVAEGGLSKLSVAAVAHEVGLVPSALYRHFKSKDEVLDAALELIQEKLLGNVAAVRDDTGEALEQLHGLLMRHVRLIQENRGIPQVIFSQDFYIDHPERRDRVYRGISSYLAEVARIILTGQRHGQIARDIDANTASVMFLGLIQPSAILWHMSDGDFDVSQQARRAWPLYRKAIENGEANPKGKKTIQQKGKKS